MKIKLVIRNRDEKDRPELTTIIERPYLPPRGFMFTITGIIDEAYVDGHYDDIPANKDYDVEVWLHTVDNDGLTKLQSQGSGWVPC